VRAVEHTVHLGPGGQVGAQQRPAVHFEAVDQVIRLIGDVQPVEGAAQRSLGAVGVLDQGVVDEVQPLRAVRNVVGGAHVGLVAQDDEQPIAMQAGLASQPIDQTRGEPDDDHAGQAQQARAGRCGRAAQGGGTATRGGAPPGQRRDDDQDQAGEERQPKRHGGGAHGPGHDLVVAQHQHELIWIDEHRHGRRH
jgi:hypothetical protein